MQFRRVGVGDGPALQPPSAEVVGLLVHRLGVAMIFFQRLHPRQHLESNLLDAKLFPNFF